MCIRAQVELVVPKTRPRMYYLKYDGYYVVIFVTEPHYYYNRGGESAIIVV